MDLKHCGLNEQPFGVTPDPRYLYLSATHKEALASLLCGIDTQRGFSALIASPGMGKTSLLFKMLESLGESARTAFLFQTDCNAQEFLRSLMNDLGIPSAGLDMPQAHEALNAMLLSERQAGRRVVVVVDEAQNLDSGVLESIRLLSNFETTSEKLMHIVLAGQPQLADKLAQPDLLQLRQRISALIRLQPLSAEESKAYIRHRLRYGGYSGQALFTPEAEDMAVAVAKGIPRNLNNVCFQALSLKLALRTSAITAAIMNEVIHDLKDTEPQPFHTSAKKARPPSGQNSAYAFPQEPYLARDVQASRTVPVLEPYVPYGRADAREFYREEAYLSPQPRSHWKRNAALAAAACFAVSWFLYVNLDDVTAGRLTDQVADAVSSVNHPPLPAPEQPKPPKAPAVEPDAGSVSEDTADSESTLQDTTLAASAEKPPLAVQTTNRDHEFAPKPPEYMRTERPLTLFQVALEQYGKSNWVLVSQIRQLNPALKSPYAIIPRGTQIRLPFISGQERNPSAEAHSSKAQRVRR